MKNKSIIAITILLVVILSLVFAYSFDGAKNSGNNVKLIVSSEGPIELSAFVLEIGTQ